MLALSRQENAALKGAGGENDHVDGRNSKQPPGMYKTL